jgi:hypothetical protein
MEKSAEEADSHSSSQEIFHLLWKKKIHYHVHKSLPLNPILSQLNTACSLLVSIIMSSTCLCLGRVTGLFLSGFLNKICV